MAKTIKEAFREFKANLEISDRQSEIISNCRKNLVKTFADSHIKLHPNQTKVIGSYARDTLIRPLSGGDIDLMIILNYQENIDYDSSEGAIKILDRFKYVLDKKYPNTDKRRDRNCITMKLNEFNLDVIPTFIVDNNYYQIPDSIEKKWIDTNPIAFGERITSINKNMDGCFIPLIKMIKAWNKINGDFLLGYHIECMMEKHYRNYDKAYTYGSMIKVFFSKLNSYLSQPSYDPIFNGRVDSYLYGNTTKILKLVENAENISSIAIKLTEQGREADAIKIWKSLFGNYFPNYG